MSSTEFQRYFVELRYLGTHFHGWQKQSNARTIQGEIEDALQKITGKTTPIIGCGRTDTGVHASYYVAHIDLEIGGLPPSQVVKAVNAQVDTSVQITSISPVANDAHARFDAQRRSYRYHLISDHDPFKIGTAFHFKSAPHLHEPKLHEAAALIMKNEQFKTFAKVGSDEKHHRCYIYESYWKKSGSEYQYVISANRFLRGMVRLIVGMCLDVATEQLSLGQVKEMMEKEENLQKRWSVPAQGLYLEDVVYPSDVFSKKSKS